MAVDSRPTGQVGFPCGTDVTDVLERATVEHLVVNDTRLVAVPGRTIFVVDVVDGHIISANELNVQLWALPPAGGLTNSPDNLFDEFVAILQPVEDDREKGPLAEEGEAH